MAILLYSSLTLAAWEFQLFPMAMLLTIVCIFTMVLFFNRVIYRRVQERMQAAQLAGQLMEKSLQANKDNVVRYDLHDRIIYQLYGDVYPDGKISLEDWKAHVHPDDLEETVRWFHDIVVGHTKGGDLFYRWNYDFTGTEPRWGYMHNFSIAEYKPGTEKVTSVISTLRDETELRRQESEESELTDKYKTIFENSIVGLSFYTPEGKLLNANKIMRDICHFDSEDYDEHFSNTNLFDSPPFSECCDPQNLEEFWVCYKSIVPGHINDYLEIRLHPIYDDSGKLIYIAIATRNISEEREMYLNAKKNDKEIKKVNERIQRYEEELRYMMESCEMQSWRISLDRNVIEFYQGLSIISRSFPLEQLPQIFVNQEDEFVRALHHPATAIDHSLSYTCQMLPLVSGHATEPQWVQINSIPEYDEEGRLKGSFGIWRNITNLMRKQDLLRSETERANDSGRLKSVFLANMTHEIRTPLNAIVGFTDLLQAIDSPDDRREMIRVIHNNCDMLLRLINDILVMSTADSNAMEIVRAEIDAAREFSDTCKVLAQRVQEPTVEFLTENPYSRCITSLDNARINQVLTNFVTNAVKYTHQGHIRLGYRIEERHGQSGFYAYCEDTGAGIPKDQCERIFERFVKLNDYIQGTGLGLSICKIIIEKCGGEIGVESEVGKGSTFWFWIPAEIKEYKEA